MKPPLRAGVIGLGVGAHQARGLEAHGRCTLAWICDKDAERLRVMGRELPKAKTTRRAQDLLEDPELDLVVVASYDEAHRDQCVAALEHGKHVYVEKPMCLTVTEAGDIRRALQAAPGLRLSSNLVLRTCPLFALVRETLQAGEMGEPIHLEADYRWGRVAKLVSGWRSRAAFYSVIHGAAVHMVDLVLWIAGRRPVAVQAMGNRIGIEQSPQRHNTFAVVLLEFEGGMTAKVTAHGASAHPHFHSLAVYATNRSFVHDITGAAWLVSADPVKAPVPETAAYPAKQERGKALASFVDSLLDDSLEPLVPCEDVFTAMSVCLAAEEAVRTGRKVPVTYV